MPTLVEVKRRLEQVFDEKQAQILAEVINDAYSDLVKTSDFNELKEIVRILGVKIGELAEAQKRTDQKIGELAEAQKRTDQKIGELAEAQKNTEKRLNSLARKVEELAEAQKRTEQRIEELAEAQKRTEQKVEELAEAQKRTEMAIQNLIKGLTETRGEVGGISKTLSYAFENEAFRHLPKVLKEKYGIEVKEKFIRTEVGTKEINILSKAQKDGKDIYIIGETKLRLDERRLKEFEFERDIFDELEEKAQAVKDEYGDVNIIKVLVTHFATKKFIAKAEEQGVIVVQSFEW